MAVAPFTSIIEASNRAKARVAGNFTLDGDDATEGTQQLVTAFNNFWNVTSHGLQLQLRFLFVNLFRAHSYEPAQLGVGQPLQICGNVLEAKHKVEIEEILPFAEKYMESSLTRFSTSPSLRMRKLMP